MADGPREVLLRALDALDEIREEHGEATRTYLVVCYAHQVEGRTISGWASTDDPAFVTAALLYKVAEVIDDPPDADEDDDGD